MSELYSDLVHKLKAGREQFRAPYTRKVEIAPIVGSLLGVLFPQIRLAPPSVEVMEGVRSELGQAAVALQESAGRSQAESFLQLLPEIQQSLILDAKAILAGDPAAQSIDEVIICYPGFYATALFRIAHGLLESGFRLLPRVITEFAHEKTGIDIHPGASIGASFCIDHGTGIVIGETTAIGEQVKLYQGVTLGALSVAKHKAGTKRHPTVEDRVVIYANATVLGGETVVGHDSIIGGSVWLTRSVPPNSTIYYKSDIAGTV